MLPGVIEEVSLLEQAVVCEGGGGREDGLEELGKGQRAGDVAGRVGGLPGPLKVKNRSNSHCAGVSLRDGRGKRGKTRQEANEKRQESGGVGYRDS